MLKHNFRGNIEISEEVKIITKSVAKEIAREVINEIMFEGKDRRLRNTRLLMRNYNALKEHLNDESNGIKINYKFEGEAYVKVDYMWLESVARSKTRTSEMIRYVDEKLRYLEKKYEEQKESEKYRSFEMHFIEGASNKDIMDELGCGKNSPKNWSDEIIRELSVLLFGIDALVM